MTWRSWHAESDVFEILASVRSVVFGDVHFIFILILLFQVYI